MANNHIISPQKVIRGEDAWSKGKLLVKGITNRPLLLGRSLSTLSLRKQIYKDLNALGLYPFMGTLENDCCEIDLKLLTSFVLSNSCDGIIAAGGGKVLDAGKLLADRLGLPVITVPLSAATCAGWTSLANIYSSKGAFIKDVALDNAPEILIFDYGFVRSAPSRTLASGIADALAKWYEASACNASSQDGMVQQAVQMARVLRDQLLIDGPKSLIDQDSDAWIRVAEGCALTAGLIGGIGGKLCRTAAAHAVHNGLTQIEESSQSLHGEKVGFGILVQLCLEEKISGDQLSGQARRQLLDYLRKLSLPVKLDDLFINKLASSELEKASEFACCKNSDLHHLPFVVSSNDLLEAFSQTANEGPLVSSINHNQKKIF